MSDRPIRTESGLTRCTVCRRHIVAAERPSLTECAFCGASLTRVGPRITSFAGRGGVLAASLLAFSAMGCGVEETSAEPTPTEVVAQPEPEPVVEPEPEPEPEVIAEPEPEPEPEAAPPPQPNRPQSPVEAERPVRPPEAIAAYGMPPQDDRFERPPERPVPMPRYGLPPSRREPRDVVPLPGGELK